MKSHINEDRTKSHNVEESAKSVELAKRYYSLIGIKRGVLCKTIENSSLRRGPRNEAIQKQRYSSLDCFALLAMTGYI